MVKNKSKPQSKKYRRWLQKGVASAFIGGTIANVVTPVHYELNRVSAHADLEAEVVDTITDGTFEFQISEGHRPIILEWNEDSYVESTAEDLGENGEHPNSYSAIFPATQTRNNTRSYRLENGEQYRINNIGRNGAGDEVDIIMTLTDHNKYNARPQVTTSTISILSDRDIATSQSDFNPSNPGSVTVLIMGADDVTFDIQFVESGTDEPLDVSIAGYWSDIDVLQSVSEDWTNRAFIWTNPDELERENGTVRAVTDYDADGYNDLDNFGYLGFGEGNSFTLRYTDTFGNFRFDLFGKFENLTYDNRIIPPRTIRRLNAEMPPGSPDRVVQEGEERIDDPISGDVIQEGEDRIVEYAPNVLSYSTRRLLNEDLEPGSDDVVVQEGEIGLRDPETDEIIREPIDEIIEYAPELPESSPQLIVDDQYVREGSNFDPTAIVTAHDTINGLLIDITDEVQIEGSVDTNEPGEYELTYYIERDGDRVVEETVTITVGNDYSPAIESLEDSVNNLNDRLNNVNEQLNQLENKVDTNTELINELQERADQLENQIDGLQGDLSDLAERVNDNEEAIDGIQDEIDTINESISQINNDINNINNRIDEVRNDLQRQINDTNYRLNTEIQNRLNDVYRLSKALKKANERINELKANDEIQDERLEALEKRSSELEEQLKQAEEDLRAVEDRVTANEEDIESINQKLDEVDDELASLHKDVDDLQHQLNLTNERINDTNNRLRQEVEERKHAIDNLQDQLDKANELIDELKDYDEIQDERISELEDSVDQLGNRLDETRDNLQKQIDENHEFTQGEIDALLDLLAELESDMVDITRAIYEEVEKINTSLKDLYDGLSEEIQNRENAIDGLLEELHNVRAEIEELTERFDEEDKKQNERLDKLEAERESLQNQVDELREELSRILEALLNRKLDVNIDIDINNENILGESNDEPEGSSDDSEDSTEEEEPEDSTEDSEEDVTEDDSTVDDSEEDTTETETDDSEEEKSESTSRDEETQEDNGSSNENPTSNTSTKENESGGATTTSSTTDNVDENSSDESDDNNASSDSDGTQPQSVNNAPTQSGRRLPDTATSTWALGLGGAVTLALGSVVAFFNRKKKSDEKDSDDSEE